MNPSELFVGIALLPPRYDRFACFMACLYESLPRAWR
jgi:hypothetical protein